MACRPRFGSDGCGDGSDFLPGEHGRRTPIRKKVNCETIRYRVIRVVISHSGDACLHKTYAIRLWLLPLLLHLLLVRRVGLRLSALAAVLLPSSSPSRLALAGAAAPRARLGTGRTGGSGRRARRAKGVHGALDQVVVVVRLARDQGVQFRHGQAI